MSGNVCDGCLQRVVWKKTPAGKAMPLDPEPRPGGNVELLADGRCRVVPKAEVSSSEPRYVAHFATCPSPPPRRPRAKAGSR